MLNINLKKRFKESVGGIVAATLTLCIIGGTNVMAGAKWGYYYLPKGGKYATDGGGKTTDNQFAGWQLEDVYPAEGDKEDTYKKMKISAYFANKAIMEERVISEGTYQKYYYQTKLKKQNVIVFKMRGNKVNLDAYAHIYLDVQ